MKNFLFAVSILISITIVSCSDSGTGPDPTNEETPTYNVSVSVNPSDGGSISPSADSTYEDGEQIELEANPNDGYLFTGWSGDIDSTKNNPLSLTVDQNYSIKANFELKNYELTINTKGEGSVSEEVLEQKSKDYEYGTVVQLTASPAEGYKFVEWQGDVTGTENPKEITIDNPKSVTAIFEKKTFPLTINISGNGTVTRNPDQTEYKYGALVDLSTTPETDWEFETWDGDTVSTSKLITVRMDSAITVTAVFNNTTFAGGNGSDAYPF